MTPGQWVVLSADVKGAISGAFKGFKFGGLFSPGGAIAGIFVGGILNGAASSLGAYFGYKFIDPIITGSSMTFQESIIYDYDRIVRIYESLTEDDYLQTDKLFATSVSLSGIPNSKEIKKVGVAHNIICDKVNNMTEEEFSALPEITDKNPLLNSIEFKAEYEKILKEAKNGFDSEVISYYNDEDYQLSLKMAYIIDLFIEAYTVNADNKFTVDDVVNFYISTISPSVELKEEEKITLFIGMVVASYSYRYWDTKCSATL